MRSIFAVFRQWSWSKGGDRLPGQGAGQETGCLGKGPGPAGDVDSSQLFCAGSGLSLSCGRPLLGHQCKPVLELPDPW